MKRNDQPMFSVAIPPQAENLHLPDPSLLNYYKDIDRRLYWLVGSVDASLYELVQHIINCNYEDKDIPVENRKPIRIIVASPGGSLEVEQTLVAIMEASATPVWCIAIGMCASAASMIYLAGHKRFATRNAYWMLHQGGCDNLEGSYQQIMSFMAKYQMDIEEMAEFYKSHTNFPTELIEKNLAEGDWYISIDEALENGICHEVITDLSVFM
ncbi:MAG: ATP-dependent Clp protease proteolytic subunit [Bacteroidaceae bacterium]|nr:ATP-dependent Clp protease proteolytic subunit [Bacteroidaceae bacterium]